MARPPASVMYSADWLTSVSVGDRRPATSGLRAIRSRLWRSPKSQDPPTERDRNYAAPIREETPIGSELQTLIDGGKRQHEAEFGNLDRRSHAVEKNGTLDAKPPVLVTRVNHRSLLVVADENIGANGWCRVVVRLWSIPSDILPSWVLAPSADAQHSRTKQPRMGRGPFLTPLHRSPVKSRKRAQNGFRTTSSASWILLCLVILGEGRDRLAQPMDPERGEVESIENVTLPPHHKQRRHTCVLAAKLRHDTWPHEGCHDAGRHPREIVSTEARGRRGAPHSARESGAR